jgi:CRISPR-associated protein Csb2
MPTVKLRFPGGRYHATPWGHHVNEGLIEWPPSPWRLLRAFLACGFSSQGWHDVPAVARRLIAKLAAVLPSYRLPAASAAHSRHFMPVGALAKGREQTTLVFDTWANVGDGELLVQWPCELDAEEAALLGKLAASLGYLGRSESWVEAQLTNDDSVAWDAVPCVENEHRGPGWEQVSLMAAISPMDYEAWREAQVQGALRPFQDQKQTGPVKKKQAQAVEPYPVDLLSCLTKDTAWWKGHGWSQPPGSRRILYWRRTDALEVGVLPRSRVPSVRPKQCMLLAITTQSGNRSALPPMTRTLPQAELFHRAVIGLLARGERVTCPELTGRDTENKPLRDSHSHAHTVPLDLDRDGRLDHILVYCPMGLGEAAQQAIRTLRRTWAKGVSGDLQLAVVASGELEDLRRLPDPLGPSVNEILGSSSGATEWESLTPFVFPRHTKKAGKNSVDEQLHAELKSRGLPSPQRIHVDPELTRALRHHVRRRSARSAAPKCDAGFGLRLTFCEPIHGPLMLGYASHYGLGLFRACEKSRGVNSAVSPPTPGFP